jgi:flagellar motor switch protein FliM
MSENLLLTKARSVDPSSLKARIKTYDFRRPDKFSWEQIRTVQNMHETFARLTTTTLSASLRAMTHVRVASVDQMTYEEFIRSIPCPATIAVVGMDPLKGHAVLEIDPSISFAILERLFGGGLGSSEKEEAMGELTDIELSVIEGIIVRLLGNLRESWTQVLDIRPRLSQIETNPQFAQIVPPSEMIILVTFETRIGEVRGMMNLCFPYMTIEPIIPKLSAQYWYSARRPDSQESLKSILGHIEGFDIDAEVLVEGESISLRELGALKKGSLLRLPGHERGEALFRMGGRELFRMYALPKKRGKPQEYEIAEDLFEDNPTASDSAEASASNAALEGALREALSDFQSGMNGKLSELAKGVSELGRRQDLLSDQLALAPPEAEGPEAAKRPERRRPFDFLGRVDPAHVLNFLVVERPQTIALVLSYLEPPVASSIFGALPQELQSKVARRIARMDRVMPEVIREVERVLEKKLTTMSAEEYTEAGGVASVVDILNMSDRSTERHVVESLERSDSSLAEEIKKRMFVFEDIVLLEPGAVAKLAERLEADTLLRAMKAANDELQAFILGALSEVAAAALKGRLEKLGRVRLSEAEAAQQRIVAKIHEMEEAGEIVIEHP